MDKRIKVFVLLIFLLTFTRVYSFSEVNFKGGAYLRQRYEYWKNIFDLENSTKDNRNYFRTKISLWGETELNEDIRLFVRLTDEFKAYTYYLQASGKKGLHFDINEVVFDNLYLDVKNFLDLPVDLRLGRQDFLFTYGEGFLIMDGTPYDGSRTFYFNAAKTTWQINDKNSLDYVYINNPRDDIYLPIINENKLPQLLNRTDEEAHVFYLKSKTIDNLYLEGYYIYKREDDDGGARLQSKKSKINTFGSFAQYSFSPYALRGQLAYQFGNYGSNNREGLGGYAFLDRDFKDMALSPKVSVGFIYLSGDDASTDTNEGWNPLFSRWPWVSELYSLTYNGESGIDYWTNLQMWRAELTLKPNEKSKLRLWYNFLRANERPVGTSFSLGAGKNRGHLPQAKFDYQFNEHVSAYVLAEYFIPGNFHADDADEAFFLRSELTFNF